MKENHIWMLVLVDVDVGVGADLGVDGDVGVDGHKAKG